jgi:hypothetical protein
MQQWEFGTETCGSPNLSTQRPPQPRKANYGVSPAADAALTGDRTDGDYNLADAPPLVTHLSSPFLLDRAESTNTTTRVNGWKA